MKTLLSETLAMSVDSSLAQGGVIDMCIAYQNDFPTVIGSAGLFATSVWPKCFC